MSQALATAVPSPRIRAKRERRREEILRAALRAFRERGYHQTTLDDIARRLDVRKSALYYYFADKESILYECHRESLAELDRIVAEARTLATPRERLRHVIREHVRVMTDTLEGSPLAFEVTAFAPERQAEIIAARDRYEREVRRMVEQGKRSGAFRRVDAKVATFAIFGAINWIARWYRPEGALQAATLGAQFADHLLDGLRAAGHAARSPAGGEPPRRATGRVRS
jgi:AcrR family transcriptional regulator